MSAVGTAADSVHLKSSGDKFVIFYGPFIKAGLSVINLLASRKVTSLSSSRSVLLPTIRMTMAGLASVLASVNQLAKQLNDSLIWRLIASNGGNEMFF